MKIIGTWSSPGGDTKLFRTNDDLVLKWYGWKSKKIIVVKDNDEGFLSKALKYHAYTIQTVMNEHDSASPLGYKQDNNITTHNPRDYCSASTSKSKTVDNKSCSNSCKECKKSVNDWVGETDSRIKSAEDKVHNILTELQNIKTQTLNSTLDQRIAMLEEANFNLKRENESLTQKFIASTCVVSYLNTKN